MNRQSPIRQIQLSIYRKIRRIFLLDYNQCKAQLSCCRKYATEVHHKQGREGWILLIVRWWLPVCKPCHDHITEHSEEAIELGLSMQRNTAREDYKSMADEDIELYNQYI